MSIELFGGSQRSMPLLGYEATLALAGARAEVILTGRKADKGEAALKKIRGAFTAAESASR